MTEIVIDASVLVKWLKPEGEDRVTEARQLRARFERGELLIVVPGLIFLELMNTAARRWRWSPPELDRLATVLVGFGFEVREPRLSGVATWATRGLTAYDAAYVALAEERGVTLISTDAEILKLAGAQARRLGTI